MNSKHNCNLQKLFTTLATCALSFSFLPVLTIEGVWGREVKELEIKEYVEKLAKYREYDSSIRTLGKQLNENAIPGLVELLKDRDENIRSSAVCALSQIGQKAVPAVPPLTLVLKDPSPRVRANAAFALGNINQKQAFRFARFTQRFSNSSPQVCSAKDFTLLWMIDDTASAVPALTQALKDKNPGVRANAAYALALIGNKASSAVPMLTEALKDKVPLVRRNAVSALGSIEKEAASALPTLKKSLKDKNGQVRSSVILALVRIGKSSPSLVPLFTQALTDENTQVRRSAIWAFVNFARAYEDKVDRGQLSHQELDEAISTLEETFKIIDDSEENFQPRHKTRVRRSLNFLKKERESRFLTRVWEWLTKNPLIIVAIVYLVCLPLLWLTLFCLRPLWLLRVNYALKPFGNFKLPDSLGGGSLPIQFVLFLELFTYRPRVLDAWVAAHIDAAREGLARKKTMSDRAIHIPVPAIVDRKTIVDFTGKDLKAICERKRSTLLIWGEGGAGKTSLACQLALWAMSSDITLRPCKHRMLPVLIEQELDLDLEAGEQALTEAICGQLQASIGAVKPIPRKLLERLLLQRRILVIIDRLSEMNEATRNQIRPGDPDFLVNALIVTSRLEENLDDVPKTTIQPLRVTGNKLSSFMEAYLTQRNKRHLFDDAQYFDACRGLSLMVGERDITVLLAKLYAEQMIASAQTHHETYRGKSLQNLPDNIPDLMLAYLNELNRDADENEPDNRTVQRDAKVIAWECLKQTFRSGTAKLDDVLEALGDRNSKARLRLKHLEKNLQLIQIISPAQDKVTFALDPLAEYLAGLYLIDVYKNDADSWQRFLIKTKSVPDIKAIEGFLLAVRDCCLVKGAEAGVPKFVAQRLAQQVEFKTTKQQSVPVVQI